MSRWSYGVVIILGSEETENNVIPNVAAREAESDAQSEIGREKEENHEAKEVTSEAADPGAVGNLTGTLDSACQEQ